MNYENLVNRIKQNDNSAIMEFYNKFYKEVYYVCYKITENEKDAEDVAQETLIKAIDKIDTLKNPEGLSSWLRTIANNLSINYLKKNRKFDIVDNSEDMGEEVFEENRVAQKTPEDIVADKEVTDILTNMINKLPREQRITIFMFYYEELSVKEIAEIMECSEATVRSRINYARKALRKQVDELENKGVKLRCIAILPFLFTVYSFEKTGVCAAIAMPSASALSGGIKGSAESLVKAGKVAGEAAKMSLKAKIAIGAVSAVVLVGGTVGVVSLATSGNNDVVDEPGLIVEDENEQMPDEEIIDTDDTPAEDELTLWLKKQSWDEKPRTTFEGGLFANHFELPLNLEATNEYCAPFRATVSYYIQVKHDKTNVHTSNINEILQNTDYALYECDADETNIEDMDYSTIGISINQDFDGTYYSYTDEYGTSGISSIELFNLNTEERSSFKTCYDNNWWRVTTGDYGDRFLEYMFNVTYDTEQFYGGKQETVALEAIVEKLGTPHKIRTGWKTKDDFINYYNDDSPKTISLYYNLVYEYPDYVLVIDVAEMIFKEYSKQQLDVYSATYYPRSFWDEISEQFKYEFVTVDELK